MIIKIVDIILLMDIKTETIAKGTIIIIIATFASKILGFIREILIAKYYGASVITDSYLIATILPSALAGIIGGALTTVFIPLFIEERNKNGDQKAWEVASSVIITSVIFLGIATLAAYFISPYFIQLVAPGFDLERYSLALRLNRIMLPSIVFHGLLGLLTGLLQAYRHFSIPALAALMYNIFLISFITIFYLNPVIGLGIGNLTGIIAQAFLVTLYLFRWKKLSLKDFKANFFHPIIKKIFLLMVPIFFGTGISYINLIVDRIFASKLPVGTIAALNFATRVKDIPIGLFAAALSQAIFPSAAQFAANDEIKNVRELLSRSLESLWLVMVPFTMGLILLARPTVVFFFQRGAFASVATTITSEALVYYSLGVVAVASLSIIGRFFYSYQDTSTPVKISSIGLLINIVLNLILVRYMAHKGLALATSISSIFISITLLEILRKKIGGIDGKVLLVNALKIVLATLIMGIFILLTRNHISNFVNFLGVGIGSVGIYAIMVIALQCRAGIKLYQSLLKRLKHLSETRS